jgi:hypothetical protein
VSLDSRAYFGGMATPRYYQVSLRTIMELVFVAAVGLAFFYWRNMPRDEPGRYQIEAVDNGQVLYIDTATGTVWRGSAYGQSWQRISTPAGSGKK